MNYLKLYRSALCCALIAPYALHAPVLTTRQAIENLQQSARALKNDPTNIDLEREVWQSYQALQTPGTKNQANSILSQNNLDIGTIKSDVTTKTKNTITKSIPNISSSDAAIEADAQILVNTARTYLDATKDPKSIATNTDEKDLAEYANLLNDTETSVDTMIKRLNSVTSSSKTSLISQFLRIRQEITQKTNLIQARIAELKKGAPSGTASGIAIDDIAQQAKKIDEDIQNAKKAFDVACNNLTKAKIDAAAIHNAVDGEPIKKLFTDITTALNVLVQDIEKYRKFKFKPDFLKSASIKGDTDYNNLIKEVEAIHEGVRNRQDAIIDSILAEIGVFTKLHREIPRTQGWFFWTTDITELPQKDKDAALKLINVLKSFAEEISNQIIDFEQLLDGKKLDNMIAGRTNSDNLNKFFELRAKLDQEETRIASLKEPTKKPTQAPAATHAPATPTTPATPAGTAPTVNIDEIIKQAQSIDNDIEATQKVFAKNIQTLSKETVGTEAWEKQIKKINGLLGFLWKPLEEYTKFKVAYKNSFGAGKSDKGLDQKAQALEKRVKEAQTDIITFIMETEIPAFKQLHDKIPMSQAWMLLFSTPITELAEKDKNAALSLIDMLTRFAEEISDQITKLEKTLDGGKLDGVLQLQVSQDALDNFRKAKADLPKEKARIAALKVTAATPAPAAPANPAGTKAPAPAPTVTTPPAATTGGKFSETMFAGKTTDQIEEEFGEFTKAEKATHKATIKKALENRIADENDKDTKDLLESYVSAL